MDTARISLALAVLACPVHSGRGVAGAGDPASASEPALIDRQAAAPEASEPPARRAVAWLEAAVCDRADVEVQDCAELALIIEEEAAAARLDPALILAVIEVESSWESDAVSHRGARGLMQLRRLAFDGERVRGGIDSADPRHPASNVRAGIRYLARLQRRFGDADLALAAYNWGPTRLAERLRQGAGVPEILHGYVRRVRGEARRLQREVVPAPLVATSS